MFTKYRLIFLMATMFAIFALVACSSAAPAPAPEIRTVEVEKVVEKEVPVEVVQERVVEVPKEVVVEVEKEVVVEKEVPVEVVTEKVVEKEVEVEKIVEVEVMAPEGPKETIVFSDLNWTSAQVQNRIAQYIVEEGYGFPTDLIFGGTLPLFQGLRGLSLHFLPQHPLRPPFDAPGVDQDVGDLIPFCVCGNAITRGPRLVAHNGKSTASQPVEQS